VALAVVALAAIAASIAQVVVVAALARALGVPPVKVVLFVGPRIGGVTLAGVPVELRAIPLGTAVELPPVDPDRPVAAALRWRHALIALVPWLAIVVLAMPLVGAAEAIAAFGRGWVQYPAGGILFFLYGEDLVDAIAHVLATAPLATVAGLTMVKLAAMNLAPFPPLGGWRVLAAAVPARMPRAIVVLGSIAMALCSIGWAVVIVTHLLEGR
jgi:hypothetical protein